MRSSVDFPQPARTDDADEFARRDPQVDVVERDHAALAAHILPAQARRSRPPRRAARPAIRVVLRRPISLSGSPASLLSLFSQLERPELADAHNRHSSN